MDSELSELDAVLEKIRTFSLDMLKLTYRESIPSELALCTSFWKSFDDEKLAIGLRGCLAIWATSGKKIVFNKFHILKEIRVPV